MGAKRSAQKMKLSRNFEPGKYSVICGRGKVCSASPGNKHLRFLVHQNLAPYSRANNKTEKSAIVSAIVNYVREASPGGAFVKQEDNGEWWEVDDAFAREKIGCIFRDILHTQYRSSTKAKQARKKAQDDCNERPAALNFESWNEINIGGMMSSKPEISHFEGTLAALDLSSIRGVRTSAAGKHTSLQNVMGKFPAPFSMPPTRSIRTFYSTKKSTCLYTGRAVSPDESSSSPLVNDSLLTVEPIASTNVQPTIRLQSERQTTSFLLSTSSSSLPCAAAAGSRKPTTLSLLEDALGVVDMDGFGDEDLPDDLSDIFDDDNALSVW
jgi:hypothetical protein